MAEAKEGPDWQKIMGYSIAGAVLFCVVMAVGFLALLFALPVIGFLFRLAA